MKRVLIVDDSDLFRDFLGKKLEGFGFTVIGAQNGFDGTMKLKGDPPDLIIMDYYLSRTSSLELLEKKTKDPNTKNIPVIMASNKIDRDKLLKVSQYGVKKFFTKPVKIDALIKAIAEILGIRLDIDSRPCIIDANCNEEVIFVEVAQGLNRDKIELLKYRLKELLEIYKLGDPKVLVMLSGFELSPNDSLDFSSLLQLIIDNAKVRPRNMKILTSSANVKSFISTNPSFSTIEIVESLEDAMDKLLGKKAPQSLEDISLPKSQNQGGADSSGLNMRFDSEAISEQGDLESMDAALKIAVVDDDFVIQQVMKAAFSKTKISVSVYGDGEEFLRAPEIDDFDLVFLDLMMPKLDGFGVLEALKGRKYEVPVIVFSALSKRETVVKAMKFGIKSYLIKPIQADGVRKKAVEMLRSNF